MREKGKLEQGRIVPTNRGARAEQVRWKKNLREVALELLLVSEQPELDVVAFKTGAGGADHRRRLVVVPGERAVDVLRFHRSSPASLLCSAWRSALLDLEWKLTPADSEIIVCLVRGCKAREPSMCYLY